MKSELSLTQLAAELERRQAAKQDMVANTSALWMSDDKKLQIGQPGHAPLPINDTAHGQIADRLGIPVKYYNKMAATTPELLARNVNHWFKANPESRMIRTLDGNVRAFLSDRYARIENEEIAQMVLPALLEQEGVKIVSAAITEKRMYIKAVFTHIQAEIKVGDVVQSGVSISNSEVGLGAVNITPFVERLVCTNGMVINDSKFSARHLGGRAQQGDGVFEMLTDETLKAEDKAILLKVRDVVRGSFDQVRFDAYCASMRAAAEDKIVGNITETVKVLAKKSSFTEFEESNVLRHLIEGADLSRWGLLNAVTRTAQDVETYDRSHELETLGGSILTLPKSEWKVLAEAS
jgi:hypothetical protein